jgi:2-polyprenyl-3-methyl-5-hydroxy-6-metoxy-1,4-benzoquinol methylase
MNEEQNYLKINKENWNKRTEAHYDSDFYNVDGFLKGETSLNPPELTLLGDLEGKTVLHLQCHFGLDSLSMQRMGAKVTGVDIADKAIDKAKALAETTGLNSQFITCDLYALPDHLDAKFDIVFTSYGTVGWLPDMALWGDVVNQFLKPGGKFIIVDFHPVLWMLDDVNMEKVSYRYFTGEAIVEEEQGSYANRESDEPVKSVWWNHSLSELMNALLRHDLRLKHFEEYDYSCYNCFPNLIEESKGVYRPKKVGNMLPMMYSLVMEKGL